MKRHVVGHRVAAGFAIACTTLVFAATPSLSAQNGEPIKIGFSMALTEPLAPNGKQALLGAKIWEEETNAKGGLLDRPVKLITYDDQSNPANVPSTHYR
jgi:branched-chain amino acid transport system substrate-binding protein